MANTKTFLQNSLLFAISTLTILIAIEITLTIYLVNYSSDKTFLKYASFQQLQAEADKHQTLYSPHRYFGYYPTPDYINKKNRHNKLGFRGDEIQTPKPNGAFRIVAIGGSTTYTTELNNYKLSYPYLLQEHLNKNGHPNVEVINAGAGGWSSWESLVNFQFRVLDLNPDMIIIYHSINDIHPRMVWPEDAYRGDNSGNRITGGGVFMPSIFEYSTLLRVFMIRAGWTTSHASLERTTDKRPDTHYLSQFRTQKKNGTYPDGIFKQVSAKQMLATNKPVYFERNIRNIISIAKDHNIQVVLSSFAHSHHFPDKPLVASAEYLSAFDENNQLLKMIAEDTKVNFFDFANEFPDIKEYYVDGRHVTENGARVKSRLFGEYLIKNELLP